MIFKIKSTLKETRNSLCDSKKSDASWACTIFPRMTIYPFVLSAPFLYPLKTSENQKVLWRFQGVGKWCIGNKSIKVLTTNTFHYWNWLL